MTTTVLRSTGPASLVSRSGDAPGVLVNRDLTNLIAFGNYPAFDPNTESSFIDPLTFVAYDGNSDVFARAVTGTPVIDVMPGVTAWAPGPIQSAQALIAAGLAKDTSVLAGNTAITLVNGTLGSPAQDSIRTAIPNNIATTGVPLLNLRTALQNVAGTVITGGSTNTFATITGITQPSYNLHVTATSGASSTKPWFTLKMNWIDTATGLVVQVDSYTAIMSSTSGVMSTVIAGPTDADSLQITITNNDTVSMTVNQLFIFMSSRPNYTTDFYYSFWTTAAMPAVATFQNTGSPVSVPTSRILFSLTRTVSNGVTTSPDYIMPCYSGQVAISFRGTGSVNWTITFTEQLTTTIIYSMDLTSLNQQNGLFIWPRAPVSLKFLNSGSVVGTLNCEVTAV